MDANVLRQLLDIGRQMAETRSLAPLLVYAVDVSITMLKAERGYLLLLQPDSSLRYAICRDETGQNIENPEKQVSKTVVSKTIENQVAIISANAVTEFTTASSVKALQILSVICVPLIAHAKVLGVLYLENRNERGIFEEEHKELLQYLASHAAVCIENARLYEELQALASSKRQEEEQSITQTAEIALENEQMRLIYSFIQDASHQFRTPLAVINTNADLLRRKLSDEKLHHYTRGIQGQVGTIVNLVESLTMMLRLDAISLDEGRAVNLNQMLSEIYQTRADLIKQGKSNFFLDLPDEKLSVWGIDEYMRQAISQVLQNASNYTPESGKIGLKLYRDAETAILEIADTGIGMSEAEQSLVFRRFYRGDKAGTTRGLGLGLPIAKKIMDLHNGRIELESAPNEGTLVRLIFPIMDGE